MGGIETFAEGLLFMAAPAALSQRLQRPHGRPARPGLNPDAGLFLEARADSGVRAVVDYAAAHPEVEGDYLALFGFSWGGHIVLKGAVNEPRIAALIANPATHNMFLLGPSRSSHPESGRNPVVRLVFQRPAWRFGLSLGNVPAHLARHSSSCCMPRRMCGRFLPDPVLGRQERGQGHARADPSDIRPAAESLQAPGDPHEGARRGCALPG